MNCQNHIYSLLKSVLKSRRFVRKVRHPDKSVYKKRSGIEKRREL